MDNMNQQNINNDYNGYNGYQQDMNNYNNLNNFNSYNSGGVPSVTKYIIFSILEFFCCCGPFAIAPLIFSILASNAAKRNDVETYYLYTKLAKIGLIVIAIAGAIVWVVSLICICLGLSS